MADDISQIIDGLRLITAQKSMDSKVSGTETKGKKGVIIDSKSGNKKSREKKEDVSATLTSNETTRYTKIFEILRNVINPDPEAARTGDTSAKDKVKDMSATTQAAAGAKEAEEGLLGKLGAIGALLATLGPLLWKLIKKKFFEYLGKFLKFLKNSFVKFLKGVGRLMARFGRFLLRTVTRAGRAIWNGLKKVGRKVLGFLKKTAKAAGQRIKDLFKGIWNSKWATSLKGAVSGAFTKLGEFMSKARNFVKNAAKRVVQSVPGGSLLMKGFEAGKDLLKKGVERGGQVLKSTVRAVQAAPQTIKRGLQSGANMIKSGIKYTKGAVKYVGGKVLKGVSQAKAALGKVLRPVLQTGKGVMKPLLTKIPIIGGAIEAGFAAYDINKYADDPKKGEQELKRLIGNRVVEGIGGVGGGALAAALTAATGAGLLVSVPAYMIGDYLGRFVAKIFTDNFDMSDLGGLVMDAFGISPAASKEDVNSQVKKFDDGVITHGGQTIRINSKDDVLALKTGGPLDSMFKDRDSNGIQDAAVFNDIKSVNIAQLQILTSIRDGIMALATGQRSTSKSSGPSTVNFKPNPATAEYYA